MSFDYANNKSELYIKLCLYESCIILNALGHILTKQRVTFI